MTPIKKVLLTGGRGYIGTNLTLYLEDQGIKVFHLDKVNGHPAEQFSFSKYNFDFIVHLAAYPGVKACAENFDSAVIDNISSAYRVFSEAFDTKTPVIFTSSQAAKYPQHSFYGTIKRIIETEAKRYNLLNDEYNLLNDDFRVLRFTNVYGGREYFERKLTIIPNMVNAYKRNENFIINGNGNQTRDFIHVKDVCDAIYKCMSSEEKMPEQVDIGTGVGVSINRIVDIFKKNHKDFLFTYNLKSDIIGPMTSTAEDTKLAKELLGFESRISLEDWLNKLKIER